MFEEECILYVIENTKNENGFPIEQRTEHPCFCEEKAITRSEFYEAEKADIKVKLILEIRIEDWLDTEHTVGGKKAYATKVKYDGCVYDIVRNYRKDKSKVQITLQ